MSESEALQRRIVQLEELFSHHERLVHQLNEAVVQLRKELSRVEAKCAAQEGRIRSLADQQVTERDPLDEKPPHY